MSSMPQWARIAFVSYCCVLSFVAVAFALTDLFDLDADLFIAQPAHLRWQALTLLLAAGFIPVLPWISELTVKAGGVEVAAKIDAAVEAIADAAKPVEAWIATLSPPETGGTK